MKIVVIVIVLAVVAICPSCILYNVMRYPYDGTSMPIFSISPGNYAQEGSVVLTISCKTADAKIRYTLDGTEPDATNGIPYDGGLIKISSDTFLKAVAYVGDKVSYLNRGHYVFTPPADYRIGEPGPAGGIIAYDKDGYSDGWRYLEVAPIELRRTGLKWGRMVVTGNRSGMETGYTETMAILNKSGPDAEAALYCWDLSYGGYSDWFLPSEYEMDIFAPNLMDSDDYIGKAYWSSSESSSDYDWACAIMIFSTGSSSKIYVDKNVRSPTTYTLPVRRF